MLKFPLVRKSCEFSTVKLRPVVSVHFIGNAIPCKMLLCLVNYYLSRGMRHWIHFPVSTESIYCRLSQIPSHDLDISSSSGLFIPAAHQILRVEFCPRGVICGLTNQMLLSQAHVNQARQRELLFVWHLRSDASCNKLIEAGVLKLVLSASCITVLLFLK